MTPKSAATVREVSAFPVDLQTMVSTNVGIDSTETLSSSVDSEFKKYTLPPAERNEIQPYRFELTVERSEDSASQNVSRDDDNTSENISRDDNSGAEYVSCLKNVD